MYILNIDKRCNPVFETIAYDIVYAIDGSKDLWSNLRIAARYKDKRPRMFADESSCSLP